MPVGPDALDPVPVQAGPKTDKDAASARLSSSERRRTVRNLPGPPADPALVGNRPLIYLERIRMLNNRNVERGQVVVA